jgi:two-component system, OmpR family, response regulator
MAETQGKILIVDDDIPVRNLLEKYLARQYTVSAVGSSPHLELFSLFDRRHPDLMILGVDSLGRDGYTFSRQVRANTKTFILMISQYSSERDVLKGFAHGADDYMPKPFSLLEITARISAMLGRQRGLPTETHWELGNLQVDMVRRIVNIDGVANQTLSRREFDVFALLAANPNKVLRRSEILKSIWGSDDFFRPQLIDVYVKQIRKKLRASDANWQIRTIRGHGYVYVLPSDVNPPQGAIADPGG